MNEKLLIPQAYFINFKKISNLLTQYKQLSTFDIAKKLDFSQNYLYPTIKAMLALGVITKHGARISLTECGEELNKYLLTNDKKNLKELGERIIFNENNIHLNFIKKAYSILKNNPNITEFDLGNTIANELGLNWKTESTYSKVGSSSKNILKGFNLLDEIKSTNLISYTTKNNNDDLLHQLHYDAGLYIFYVSNDENGWKNHIDLKETIENKFNKLINNQYATPTILLLKESKRCFKRGISTKDIEEIRHSLELLYAIKINNLIK